MRISPYQFFTLTFALSWLFWIPLMLVRLGVLGLEVPQATLTALALPGVLMPALSGLVLAWRSGGGTEVRRVLRGLLVWRAGWLWAVVLLAQPVLLLATAWLYNRLGLSASVTPVENLAAVPFLMNLVFIVIASAGEEIGWRGVALPSLQARYSSVRSSWILGLLGATWHLPYWILLGTLADYGPGYFLVNYVFVVALTFQLTWIFNRSHSSLLLVVAFHFAFNAVNVSILPVTGSVGAFLLLTAFEVVVALGVARALQRRAGAAGLEGEAEPDAAFAG